MPHLLRCGATRCAPAPRLTLAFVRLGVLKQTRLVKECLHRFCAPCIERSLRIKCVCAVETALWRHALLTRALTL